ncbi:MAG TPA: hypothetical protein VFB99_13785 [Vicinamibacterales bacterium]|nr:hypothetical protein [Vicinamibacterales bacterium]
MSPAYFVIGRSVVSSIDAYSTVLYDGPDSQRAYGTYYAAVEVAKAGGYAEAVLYEQQPVRRRRIVPGHRFVAAEWREAQGRPAKALGEALAAAGQAVGLGGAA